MADREQRGKVGRMSGLSLVGFDDGKAKLGVEWDRVETNREIMELIR